MDSSRTKELGALLADYLQGNPLFQEALSLTRQNSDGNIWLIGSTIYRTLAHAIYGGGSHIKDFDFLVDQVKTSLILPEGWTHSFSRFGSPKLKKGETIIDIVPMSNVFASIKKKDSTPSVVHYLYNTPFTIQSIAFDMRDNKLIGEVGIQSLLSRTVAIHNKESHAHCHTLYGESFSAKKYVDGLGFSEI